MPTEIVVEGHVDQSILKALAPDSNVPLPQTPLGREAAMKRAALAARQVGVHRIVLMLDRNGYSQAEIESMVGAELTVGWGQTANRDGSRWYLNENSSVRLVLAGLSGDDVLTSLGITRFTSDEYLLRLIWDDESLQAFCAPEHNLSFRPENSAVVRELLIEMANLLRRREIAVESAKRYMHFVRAILGFEASRATLAQHLIERSPEGCIDRILGQLRHDLLEDPPE